MSSVSCGLDLNFHKFWIIRDVAQRGRIQGGCRVDL